MTSKNNYNMAKTENITITCNKVEVVPMSHSRVGVELQAVNAESILCGIHREDTAEWCRQNMQVEDIFSETQLEKWAEANGYVKGGSNA